MDDIREKLDDEIRAQLELLSKTKDKGERTEITANLSNLYKMRLDDKKLDNENDNQAYGRKAKLRLDIAGLIIPNSILLGSVVAGYIFEHGGVFVRSDTMKRILGSIKPSRFIRMFK